MFLKYCSSQRIFFLCTIVVFISGFYQHDLSLSDETREAAIILHMFWEKHFLLPIFDNHFFVEKPPLYYWSQLFFLHLNKDFFSYTDVMRFVSLLWGVGTLTLTYLLARIWIRVVASSSQRYEENMMRIMAVGILLSCNGFLSNALTIRIDIALAFFTVLMAYGFSIYYIESKPWGLGIAIFALCGGFLCKGVIAWAFAGIFWVTLLPWILPKIRQNPSRFFFNDLLLPFLFILLVSFFWVWALYYEGGVETCKAWLVDNTLLRITGGGKLGHEHPMQYGYYLTHFLSFSAPWGIIWILILGYIVFQSRKSLNNLLMPALWTLLPLLFLTMMATKRPVYLLPILPFFSISLALLLGFQFQKNYLWAVNGLLVILIGVNFCILPRYNEALSGREGIATLLSSQSDALWAHTVTTPLTERMIGYLYLASHQSIPTISFAQAQALLEGNNPKHYERMIIELHGFAPELSIPRDKIVSQLIGREDTKYNTLYLINLREPVS